MGLRKYTHLELNKDVCAIAGYYTPQKEVRLKYDSQEVLYVVGHAAIESSCCASGCWDYALVPGYIRSWQSAKNEACLPVSEVETISDRGAREDINRLIAEAEGVSHIEFW